MQKKVTFSIVLSFFTFAVSLSGQCPDKETLWKRLDFLVNSSTISTKDQLAELLPIEATMSHCPYKNDSTHAFLLRRIGANYFLQGDYLNAVQYYRESIKIVTENANGGRVNPRALVSSYYFLSVFYASLNNVLEEMRALDSCI